MKVITCNDCKKRDKCRELCPPMIKMLDNSICKNGLYSNGTHNTKNVTLNESDIDKILFTSGLSNVEKRDVKRIIISLLPARDSYLIKMYCEGMPQKEIAKKMNCSQAAVSKKIYSIRKRIEKSIVLVIPYIS